MRKFAKGFGVFLVIFILFGCSQWESNLDGNKLATTPGFLMSANLMGTIVQSSNKAEIGKKINFIALDSNISRVLFESGVASPFQKVYESEDKLTLVLVASGTGSVDTFVIEKKTGKFARAAVGSVAGVYAQAALGVCK